MIPTIGYRRIRMLNSSPVRNNVLYEFCSLGTNCEEGEPPNSLIKPIEFNELSDSPCDIRFRWIRL